MTYNRKCVTCGTEYYACGACVGKNSWKNLCCSRECYRKYIEGGKEEKPNIIEFANEARKDGLVLLRGGLESGSMMDIYGYDLALGRFDCADGQTRGLDSFKFFIWPREEMKDVGEYISNLLENKSNN